MDIEKIVGFPYGMITLAPKEGLCKSKNTDECTGECIRCNQACMYQIELHRSGSPCHTDGK